MAYNFGGRIPSPQEMAAAVIARMKRRKVSAGDDEVEVIPPPKLGPSPCSGSRASYCSETEDDEDEAGRRQKQIVRAGLLSNENSTCSHEKRFAIYLQPCNECDVFCNCNFTFNHSNAFPNVLVRSLDGKIVRLSKHFVSASFLLSEIVKGILTRAPENGPIKEEYVVVATEPNYPQEILKFWEVRKDEDLSDFLEDLTMDEMMNVGKYCGGEKGDEGGVNDVFNYNKKEKVLLLFNTDDSEPTLGIKKDVLIKIDQYICQHLEEVEIRAEAKRRAQDPDGLLAKIKKKVGEENDLDEVVYPFRYEDWEEEFFNIDTIEYLELHQANQELLVWDLHFALEKWVKLWRGFPQIMENGIYEPEQDPEYQEGDQWNTFAVSGAWYRNPKGRSFHSKTIPNMSVFNKKEYIPKWWILKPLRNQDDDDCDLEIVQEVVKVNHPQKRRLDYNQYDDNDYYRYY